MNGWQIAWAVSLTVAAIIQWWIVYRLTIHFMDIKSQQSRMMQYIGELQIAVTRVEGVAGIRNQATVDKITGILTDSDMLDAELDKSAQRDEMRRARRKHLPRENAGPPATVRRMRFGR